eukprot:15452951-Alexandrium_andersonii.AAC.1
MWIKSDKSWGRADLSSLFWQPVPTGGGGMLGADAFAPPHMRASFCGMVWHCSISSGLRRVGP